MTKVSRGVVKSGIAIHKAWPSVSRDLATGRAARATGGAANATPESARLQNPLHPIQGVERVHLHQLHPYETYSLKSANHFLLFYVFFYL